MEDLNRVSTGLLDDNIPGGYGFELVGRVI